jgi:hypothetical protein
VKSYLDKDTQSIAAIPDQAKIGLINVLNNSFGTKYDKERLEMGLSTSNIAYAEVIKGKRQAEDDLAATEAEIVELEGKTTDGSV